MKLPRLIPTLLLLTILHTTLSEDVPVNLSTTEEAVINLNQQNFDHLVQMGRSERWFIMFHIGCPSCQEVYPAWDNFTKSRRGIRLGSVNSTTYPELTVRFGILSFPSFVFFDEGKMEVYHGENTNEGWNNFISRKKGAENVNQTLPDLALQEDPIVNLDLENFDSYVLAPSTRAWFVMFHTHCPECETAFPAWREFARSRKEGPNIGMADCDKYPELAKRFEISSFPTFIYFEDGEQQIFNGERRVKEWSQYVDQKKNKDLAAETPVINITNNTAPHVSSPNIDSSDAQMPSPVISTPETPSSDGTAVELTRDNFDSLVNSPNAGPWFIMFYAPWCPHCQVAHPIWKEFAATKKEGVRVGTVNCVDQPELQGRFGIPGFPTFMYLDNGQTEVFNGPRTVEAWSQFVDGKRKPSVVDQAEQQPLGPAGPTEPIGPDSELPQEAIKVGDFERPIDNLNETRTGASEQPTFESNPEVLPTNVSTEVPEMMPTPSIGNLNALNATIAGQNDTVPTTESIRPALDNFNGFNETITAQNDTIAYTEPTRPATENFNDYDATIAAHNDTIPTIESIRPATENLDSPNSTIAPQNETISSTEFVRPTNEDFNGFNSTMAAQNDTIPIAEPFRPATENFNTPNATIPAQNDTIPSTEPIRAAVENFNGFNETIATQNDTILYTESTKPVTENFNIPNSTVAAQNDTIPFTEPTRPASELNSSMPETTLGGLNSLNRTYESSETPETPMTAIQFERPAAGINQNRPSITIETEDNDTPKTFDNGGVHYKEPMLVLGVIAVLLLGSFFTFLCYQQFRGKYSPVETADPDIEANSAAIDTSDIKRDSFSHSMRF